MALREGGLSEICDQLEDAKDARMEEEKSELSKSLLEKIPECPVNIKLYFTVYTVRQIPSMFCFPGLF